MDINLDTISNKRIKYELLSLVGLPIPKKIETTLNSNVLCELITRENIDYKCKIVIYFRITLGIKYFSVTIWHINRAQLINKNKNAIFTYNCFVNVRKLRSLMKIDIS